MRSTTECAIANVPHIVVGVITPHKLFHLAIKTDLPNKPSHSH